MSAELIHYKVRGQGQPLVMIHGLFGSLENLAGIARIFAEHYQVYLLDLPNHGRSLHTDETSLEHLADTLLAWMDDVGLTSAYFFGHSLGGKVAMEIALQQPRRVRALVVADIAPVDYPPRHDDVFAGMLAVNPSDLQARSDADAIMKNHVTEIAVRSFLLKNLVKREDGRFAWRVNLPVIHRAYPNLIKGNRVDARYPGKVLFLKGGDSDYLKEQYREQILARFPAASLKVVADTSHWLHAEKPELVARLTLNFYDR